MSFSPAVILLNVACCAAFACWSLSVTCYQRIHAGIPALGRDGFHFSPPADSGEQVEILPGEQVEILPGEQAGILPGERQIVPWYSGWSHGQLIDSQAGSCPDWRWHGHPYYHFRCWCYVAACPAANSASPGCRSGQSDWCPHCLTGNGRNPNSPGLPVNGYHCPEHAPGAGGYPAPAPGAAVAEAGPCPRHCESRPRGRLWHRCWSPRYFAG